MRFSRDETSLGTTRLANAGAPAPPTSRRWSPSFTIPGGVAAQASPHRDDLSRGATCLHPRTPGAYCAPERRRPCSRSPYALVPRAVTRAALPRPRLVISALVCAPSRAAICLQALPWGRLRPNIGKQGCQASVLCGWTSKTHMPAYHAGGPAMPFRRPEAGMVDRDIRRVWRGTPLLPGGTTPSLPLTGPRADRRWTRRRHLRRRWGLMRPTESSRDMPLVRASRGRASSTRFRT